VDECQPLPSNEDLPFPIRFPDEDLLRVAVGTGDPGQTNSQSPAADSPDSLPIEGVNITSVAAAGAARVGAAAAAAAAATGSAAAPPSSAQPGETGSGRE